MPRVPILYYENWCLQGIQKTAGTKFYKFWGSDYFYSKYSLSMNGIGKTDDH